MLLLQNMSDRVVSLVAVGDWSQVAREKASSLRGMSTTLTAYSQLLESTAHPPHGGGRTLNSNSRWVPP
jgi:hypothetical protein